ncbi:MAG: hypothetical protein LUG98_00540 [Tannerellaceae bacterium]|nr:hypothetical protein [Tannerellaceae bacterium]
MKQLHYFNPGHEASVCQRNPYFTPSVNVRKMTEDLAWLPVWYARPGDWVWTGSPFPEPSFSFPAGLIPPGQPLTTAGLRKKKDTGEEPLEGMPWGISPDSVRKMRELKKSSGYPLTVPEWKEEYVALTGRSCAAECLTYLRELYPSALLPAIPLFFHETETLRQYINRCPGQYILKSPYSSSGRGLVWVEGTVPEKEWNWIRGVLTRQGSISLEPALDKIRDFGWEFLSDGEGKVVYKGISPFTTNAKGAFERTFISSQQQVLADIYRLISPDVYDCFLEGVTRFVREKYSYRYKGCIGVDILVYRTATGGIALHPCVEINMRYTMGYLALQLEQFLYAEARATFQITYHKDPADGFREHLRMQESHPLEVADNKIRSGYLSLCPVTSGTHYKATLWVKSER